MQAVLDFIQHIAVTLIFFGQALLILLLPHQPIAVIPPQTQTVATSSIQKLFPVAGTVKATASSTASVPKQTENIPSQQTARSSTQTGQQLLHPSVVNEITRASLVNIFCVTKGGGYLYPISGSGVMITKNGVILTNAHVGQYFLLRDYLVKDNVDCTIRTGNPATNAYRAELLYLPPAWITANASQITVQEGMGTGQYDFAFLRITAPIDSSKALPESFPAITMTTDDPSRAEPVLLGAYPAGFLSGMTISTNLYMSTAVTQVNEIFAFDDRGDADLMSLGGSVVAQAGSSGGAVVRQQDGSLQGLIATETETASSTSTSARDLHAITLGHIDRSLREAGMGSMAALLSGDLQTKAADFAKNIAPGERQKLIDVLNKR